MRIKKFVAQDMNKLMLQVKKELGPDAAIISTSQLSDGSIELIAAVESDYVDFNENLEPEISSAKFNDTFIRECLAYHEPVLKVQATLLAHCRQIIERDGVQSDKQTLAKVFEETFEYYDLFGENSVKMFMGTQGGGKSTALAKVAAMAKVRGISTAVISTDNVRAGTNNQLKAFTDILEADFHFIKDSSQLAERALGLQSSHRLVLIDTPGINPFIARDIEKLTAISEAIRCDKILTMDAGRNAHDAVEAAEIFRDLGANCFLPTKLDLTRRIGALISIPVDLGLKLGYASVSSSIAKGLAAVNNSSLAGLVLE